MALSLKSALDIVSTANNNAGIDAGRYMKGESRLECRAGCAWCCYMPIDVFAPEALFIAQHLRLTPRAKAGARPVILSAAARKILQAQLDGHDGEWVFPSPDGRRTVASI